jgi:retron-type reverse transcriptase
VKRRVLYSSRYHSFRSVKANKGSAGVDGMTVDRLTDYLKQHWPTEALESSRASTPGAAFNHTGS